MNISDTSPVDLKPNSRSSSVMSVDDDLFAETKRRRLVNSATNSVESSPCPSSVITTCFLCFTLLIKIINRLRV